MKAMRKKLIFLAILFVATIFVKAQNDTLKAEKTVIKVGKTKVLVVEESGNKTIINIAPGTNVKKILKQVFSFTDSIVDITLEAFELNDTVEVVKNNEGENKSPIRAGDKSNNEDSVSVKIGENQILIVDSENKTLIKVYQVSDTIPNDTIKSKQKKEKDHKNPKVYKISVKKTEKKFKGDWFGFEFGVNTLFNGKDFNLPPQYSAMELNYSRSWFFGLNILKYDVGIIKENFGFVTGLGLQFRNYRFIKPNVIFMNNDSVSPFLDTTYNYLKSKLQVSYLRLPIFLEFKLPEKNNFHFMMGVIGDLLIGAHTKNVFYTEDSENRTTKKGRNILFLNFLNYSLSVRIGLEKFTIFAEYGMMPVFRENKGPVLYPLNFGIKWNF